MHGGSHIIIALKWIGFSKAINDLKEEGMLVHLGKAEDLAEFVTFDY
jgi:hypothetical protein